MLAGHTHCGQIRLPLIGAIVDHVRLWRALRLRPDRRERPDADRQRRPRHEHLAAPARRAAGAVAGDDRPETGAKRAVLRSAAPGHSGELQRVDRGEEAGDQEQGRAADADRAHRHDRLEPVAEQGGRQGRRRACPRSRRLRRAAANSNRPASAKVRNWVRSPSLGGQAEDEGGQDQRQSGRARRRCARGGSGRRRRRTAGPARPSGSSPGW